MLIYGDTSIKRKANTILMELEKKIVSLGEGNTPLIPSQRIGPELGVDKLFFKLENLNPTGSFKDRFVALEIASALKQNQTVCIATSSGNTGSSLASYASRYGISCHIFINEITPDGKMQQMLAHGAQVYRIRRFGISVKESVDTFRELQDLADKKNYRLIVSAYRYSPAGMRGVETLAHEIVDQLSIPYHIFVPVGGGGLITAVWRGFVDSYRTGKTGKLPHIHAVQPADCSTVVRALQTDSNEIVPIDSRTSISGLGVPFDIDGSRALAAVRDSGGLGIIVNDEDVWEAQEHLCKKEGIYAEPAGATTLAGMMQALSRGLIDSREAAVCIITGHGFKDPASIEKINRSSMIPLIEKDEIFELELN